uniref:Variant surface glycoprotein 770 n=1 Tax=Trypanosoma brucei TaxID=5691 RepID=M4SXC6_9TRYP|nr:variant surface glycoprotein 770 [Trypanosoma brucei]
MLFTLAITILALTSHGRAALTLENRHDLLLLCDAANLRGREVAMPKLPDDFDSGIADIEKMNMSVAANEWQDIFSGDPESASYAQKHKHAQAEPFKSHWQKTYDKWLQIKHETTKKDSGKSWLDNNPPPTGWAAAVARRSINGTLEKLITTNTLYKGAKEEATTTLPAQVVKQISAAIYGEGVEDSKFVLAKALTALTNWGAACSANGGKSVIGDMICLCAESGSPNPQTCENSGLAIAWNSDLTGSPHTLVLGECQKQETSPIALTELGSIITRITAGIRTHKQGTTVYHILGKRGAGNCNGGDGEVCVDYSAAYTKKTGKGLASIKWGEKLISAYNTMQQSIEKANEAATQAAIARRLIDTARAAYSQPIPQPPQATQTTAPPATKQAATVTITNTTCEKKGKEDNCKDGCKEVSENGEKKCVVGIEIEKEDTTNQDGKIPSDRCTRHKDKAACKKRKMRVRNP